MFCAPGPREIKVSPSQFLKEIFEWVARHCALWVWADDSSRSGDQGLAMRSLWASCDSNFTFCWKCKMLAILMSFSHVGILTPCIKLYTTLHSTTKGNVSVNSSEWQWLSSSWHCHLSVYLRLTTSLFIIIECQCITPLFIYTMLYIVHWWR